MPAITHPENAIRFERAPRTVTFELADDVEMEEE
jgi:hypothetical protein